MDYYYDVDYDNNYQVENYDDDSSYGVVYDENEEWKDEEIPFNVSMPLTRPGEGINPLFLIVMAVMAFTGFIMLLPLGQSSVAVVRPVVQSATTTPEVAPSTGGRPANAFIAPYDDYWVTQGVHGTSYGHMAVDIAGGKGATIRSPIAGRITDKRTDGVGNTVLVIENAFYTVMMLHGDYTVEIGDEVSWGDKVGEESNHGYTMDMQGRLCTGRDCGYHTHLNVFDKQLGRNVNPLNLLSEEAHEQLVVGSRVQRDLELP